MKAVIKYQTSNGREFTSEKMARDYESLLSESEIALSPIGPQPDIQCGCWIQHKKDACLQAKRNVMRLVRKQYTVESLPILAHDDDVIHPCCIIGRVLCDSDSAINRAWGRLMCINWDNFREYDQPYFAMNPHETNKQAK